MATSCHFQHLGISSNIKRYWVISAAILILLVLVVVFGCSVYSIRQSTIEMMYAMYDELEAMPDFDILRCRDGSLYLYSQKNGEEREVITLPLCLQAMSSGRIKSVTKIGDDVFFKLHGIVDNYSGYVLSKDTTIHLNELDSVNREIKYEFGLRCYSFYSR